MAFGVRGSLNIYARNTSISLKPLSMPCRRGYTVVFLVFRKLHAGPGEWRILRA